MFGSLNVFASTSTTYSNIKINSITGYFGSSTHNDYTLINRSGYSQYFFYRSSASSTILNLTSPYRININITLDRTFKDYDYFYIYGFSRSAYVSSGFVYSNACELVSNNPSNDSQSSSTMFYPFALKCSNSSVVNNGTFNFHLNLEWFNYTNDGENWSSQISEIGLYENAIFVTDNSSASVEAKIQQQLEEQQKTNNKLDKVQDSIDKTNDTLTNSSVDNPSSNFEQFNNSLPTNGTISNLILLPITLFTKILNSLNGTCTSFSLGNMLGTDLILPCINVSNYVGTALWGVIDVLFSGLFVFVISKQMIKVFNNFTQMKDGDILD